MRVISYGCTETENFDLKGKIKKGCKWAVLKKVIRRKLDIILVASCVEDLKVPPSNKFKYLKGDLIGFASIRINKQWRIIFKIVNENEVEHLMIVDYH